MLFVKFKNNLPVEVSNDYPCDKWGWDSAWQNRTDWTSYEQVQCIARYLTAMTGDLYVGTERPNSYPKFDIVQVPKVGDEVSYAFNGDCYPDGKVVKVTKTLQVKTDTGKTYRREKQTGSWTNGSWSLVQGHIFEQNPSF